jgi:hypothetical protein
LEGYVQDLRATGKVRYGEKSYPLPNGQRIGYHWAEADWHITDPDALFTWAKTKGLVRVQEETDWGAQVKPRLMPLTDVVGSEAVDRDGGEMMPGVVLQRPAGEVLLVSEVRRRRRAGGADGHADVHEHVGMGADPRVGARGDVV